MDVLVMLDFTASLGLEQNLSFNLADTKERKTLLAWTYC